VPLVPQIPHISTWLCTAALLAAIAAFGWAGILGFRRRSLD